MCHSCAPVVQTERSLGKFFSVFLQFSPATNFIPQFLHTHLIHFVSFHFIHNCEFAPGLAGRHPCFSRDLNHGSQPVRSQQVQKHLSTLSPSPLSSSLSLFLASLKNIYKTKVFPVHLKTILEVVLSELKIWDFHHYVQETVLVLKKHQHSLKLQYLLRAHVIFQSTHQQGRAARFVLGNVVKT